MKVKQTNTRFKTIRKVVFRTILVLLLLVLVTGIALTMPVVQTKIAHYYSEKLNKQYGTNIYVDQVAITIFGSVKLKNVLVKDHHNDTLIYSKRINTSILDSKKLLDGDLIFGAIRLEALHLKIKTYKNEKATNLDKFIGAFDSGKKSGKKFSMTSEKITLTNSHVIVLDENRVNSKDIDFTKLNAVVTNFKIYGPDVTTNIQEMAFLDHRGLVVENLKSKFTYTKTNIKLENLDLKTQYSKFVGKVILNYDRKDFADFNNKVKFDIKTDSALISTNDIRYFYKDIAKDQTFNLKAKIDGTLNNITLKNLNLIDSKNSQIIGDVNLRNLFPKNGQEFYMKGSFGKVASSYENLTSLLPKVLGKKLPTSLKKLGRFNLVGDAEITPKTIDADLLLETALGVIRSKLVMSNLNNIDNASYNGRIALDNFDIGSFLNRKDIGRVTMDVDVDGKGFNEKYLDTKFSGEIQSVKYNGYTYKNIIADGNFKKPIFKGNVSINDPNLFLDFDGTVDLSKQENIYDFHAVVDYANLSKLNIINESISVFKGDIVMKVSGSTINNLKGDVVISNASYQNPKSTYFFDNIVVNSKFDSFNERTITIISPDAINAEIVGKYDVNQIQKLIENSLGSLYTNYKSNNLKKGQYLKFNISQFNKIVEILNPKIVLDSTTTLRGSINGDDNDLKLKFSSKKVNAFDTGFDNVLLEIDNKNPLYNTYVQIDSIKTKMYKVRDFSLINVTSKDTLSFRTEFKGGEKGNDFYNLNLYHTISKDNQNIIGFNKSEMMFKDFIWYINENENDKNKIVFDKSLKNFTFEDIIISHENQSIALKGLIKGTGTKDIQLTFKDVNLNKVTPEVQKFKFDGSLNGEVFLKQNNSVYQPTAALEIKDLYVNDNQLGNLFLNIEGDENFKKFNIASEIENENLKSFKADGNLQIVNEETLIDLDLNFQKFNLGVLSNLGGDVLSNIRGFISGNATLDGNIKNIDYNGRLFASGVGLTVPYLNVDYMLTENSIIDVTQNKFIIQNTEITDTKFKTQGNLNGFIKHKQFSGWELDLEISTNRLLALNTKDQEDAAYYGVAFIKGDATIKGPTAGLTINVNAESEKGTDIKIPINDAESATESNFIRFTTKNEKYGIGKPIIDNSKNYNGLEMNFDFNITEDATIEVILDRNSGHGMRGKGRGGLLFSINTRGKFQMFGDFQVYEGIYNFKYGGLIDKKFEVKKYGSIVWEGDPMRANLNLEAVYKTQANPALLVQNSSINKKTEVEVIIGIKGNLATPEPDFNINFPNVGSVLKSEIETKLGTKEVRQTQALALLATGSFISEDSGSIQYANSFYERASALFGDLFQDSDSKIQLSVGYVQADRTLGAETDGRFTTNLSTKINERITINGQVGVPVGGVNESTIVGNVEVEYRVNEDGTLNLRVFNRENDISYIGQGVGYTQGVGVSYEVDFDTFSELVNKIFGKNKLGRAPKSNVDEDSEMVPDYIKFDKDSKDKKKKAKQEVKQNQEAIPVED